MVALASVLVSGLISAGCAGARATVSMEIAVRHSRYAPAAITVPQGVPVAITLRNEDPIDHEWIVGDEGVHDRHRTGTEPAHEERPTEQTLPALGLRRTMVTFGQAGVFRFICHLPGHEAYGMVGTVTVTDA